VTVFGTASRNEAADQVRAFLSTASPEALARFRETSVLPEPYASQVLAQGVSAAFRLAAIMAVVALIVTVVAIRSKAGPAAPTGPAGPAAPTGSEADTVESEAQ
jgi:hypothetical protein